VDELGSAFVLAIPLDRETFGRDANVLPVILAQGDHRLKRETVVDDNPQFDRFKTEEFAEIIARRKHSSLNGLHQIGEMAVMKNLKILHRRFLLTDEGQRMSSLLECRGAHRFLLCRATPFEVAVF